MRSFITSTLFRGSAKRYAIVLNSLENLSYLDWPNFRWKILGLVAFAFFACGASYLVHGDSVEAVGSSARILLSTLFFVGVGRRQVSLRSFARFTIVFALLNAALCLWQLGHAVFAVALPSFLESGYFWGGRLNEPLRQAGLLNGYQTAAGVSFIALVLLSSLEKSIIANLAAVVLATPMIFGGRTFIPLLVVVLAVRFRPALFIILGFLIFLLSYGSISGLEDYIVNRILPVFKVIFQLDLSADYSSKDTASMYRLPGDVLSYFFGNGADRYSYLGGKDPFFSRWLNQAGIFVALSYVLSETLIAICLTLKFRFLGLLLALAIIASSVKGELSTAVVIYDVFLFMCAVVAKPVGRSDDSRHALPVVHAAGGMSER